MSYPFVQAKYYTPGGMTEPRAIVIHMAAGGGTVSWLTHPTNDNSSHFVIEYSGRIVQMVKDADADHSLHIGRPYGPPGAGDYGIFSLDVAKVVLGSGIADPNRYLFAVENEGYAANGPNAAQATSLAALVRDLRARHPSIRGLLGHADFQIKDCPGGKIPWAALGGHGLFVKPPDTSTAAGDPPMRSFGRPDPIGGAHLVGDGTALVPLDGGAWDGPWPAGTNFAVYDDTMALDVPLPGGAAGENRASFLMVRPVTMHDGKPWPYAKPAALLTRNTDWPAGKKSAPVVPTAAPRVPVAVTVTTAFDGVSVNSFTKAV